MKIVDVWPRGYADSDGLKSIRIDDAVDPKQAAVAAFGYTATVYSIRPAITTKVKPVSEAYARMMSQHDNS